MAYIEILTKENEPEDVIYQKIKGACIQVLNSDHVYLGNREIQLLKKYSYKNLSKEGFLIWEIHDPNKFKNEPDERNPLIYLDIVPNTRVTSVASADKMRSDMLLFEFSIEFFKQNPEMFLLVNQGQNLIGSKEMNLYISSGFYEEWYCSPLSKKNE